MTDYKRLCLSTTSEDVLHGQGKNVIPEPQPEPLWRGFLRKFRDPLIVVLLVVFCLSTAVSIWEVATGRAGMEALLEPGGVLAALLLATLVGFIFEVRAEREFRILNRRKDERPVKVLRWAENDTTRPQLLQIAKCDVVVGDVVRLESGDEVPADGCLIQSQSLLVDESAFTGELYAEKFIKKPDPDLSQGGELSPIGRVGEESADEGSAYPPDFLLRGSIVIEGHCIMHVTATGMDTEEGHGARIIQEEAKVTTPLDAQLSRLGHALTWASYAVAALIVVGRMAYYFTVGDGATGDVDALDIVSYSLASLMLAITLIVVAVPEGLPMSVTISLALSMRRMLRENNLVRKLHACETMGAATVICTDKTGTLTRNRLRVMEDSELLLADISDIARGISVNSTAELTMREDGRPRSLGNPTEGALLYWLRRRKGLDYMAYRDDATIISQEPFSPVTKRMTTVAFDAATNTTRRYVKGAPEVVLAFCDKIAGGMTREQVEQRLAEMQQQGRRTLAFAEQILDQPSPTSSLRDGSPLPSQEASEKGLTLVGVVGMTDPVRTDVADAIGVCRGAGVRVIMVTGDVALTASQIARQTGIGDQLVITGEEFAATSDERLISDVLPRLTVLARARPADKSRLVELLQRSGEVVAVTGDGTNDAPALAVAHVGLSMGDGTSRAKEASDITIIDNSFASITKAILWGRSIYMNIRRFILFQMTINVTACLIVLVGAFTGQQSPLGVTEMLWVNLIMDTFAAMALSALPPDERVMHEPPRRPDSHIIDRGMAVQTVTVGLLLFAPLLALWLLLLNNNSGSAPITHLASPYDLGLFFTTFVMLQFWNLFNARYFRTGRSLTRDIIDALRDASTIRRHFSPAFAFIAAVILIGQVGIVSLAYEMFGIAPLALSDWLRIILFTSPVLIIGEIIRESSLITHKS